MSRKIEFKTVTSLPCSNQAGLKLTFPAAILDPSVKFVGAPRQLGLLLPDGFATPCLISGFNFSASVMMMSCNLFVVGLGRDVENSPGVVCSKSPGGTTSHLCQTYQQFALEVLRVRQIPSDNCWRGSLLRPH